MDADSLRRASSKLRVLTELYERVRVARVQVKAAQAAGAARPDLTAELHLLHFQCSEALDDLQAAYGAMKVSDSTITSQHEVTKPAGNPPHLLTGAAALHRVTESRPGFQR